MKVLRAVGKAVLAIVLGVIALMVANIVMGSFFGFFGAFFGWPTPSFTTQNLILLGLAIVALRHFRNERKSRPAPPPISPP